MKQLSLKMFLSTFLILICSFPMKYLFNLFLKSFDCCICASMQALDQKAMYIRRLHSYVRAILKTSLADNTLEIDRTPKVVKLN